uniref:Uncharacterized protein n=1 Tax=Pseudo-nitzschia australis TaxID=44445 RepID=A0A7S4AJS3_9STRA
MMQIQMTRQRLVALSRMTVASRYQQPKIATGKKDQVYRRFSDAGKGKEDGSMYLVKAGLPLFLFCGLGVWVVSSGIEGKNRERDAFQGRISKYVRTRTGQG